MEPTEQNIGKIIEDLSKNLYESCYAGSLVSRAFRALVQALAFSASVGRIERFVSSNLLSSPVAGQRSRPKPNLGPFTPGPEMDL